MTEQRIRYLFERYFTDSCTEIERLEFLRLIHEGRQDDMFLEVLQDCWDIYAPEQPMPEDAGERVLHRIMRRGGSGNGFFSDRRTRWITGVAALLALCVVSGYLLRGYFTEKKAEAPMAKAVIHDVGPGGNKAILRLANGKTIILDSAANGKLAQQGDVKVIKMQDGKLGFEGAGAAEDETVRYNTISTPYGGKYQVVLTDGTKVWLNAASTLVFPTAFKGGTREVSLKGEGYFEVSRNASQPFVVKVGDMKVDVLGTSFNIMAYDDEAAVRTTLVDGAVKVGVNGVSRALEVGEQGVWDRKGRMDVIHDADVEEALAWKNGLLQFHSAGMPVIMRQLSRWYNVQIVYANEDIKNESFSGSIPSSENISQVLKLLQMTGTVHFDVNGQQVTVRR